MSRALLLLFVLAAAAAGTLWAGEYGYGPVVIVHEDEQKIVLLFGKEIAVLTEPGLALRVPLLTEVVRFDKRALYLNTEPEPIQTRDEERLVVDNYVIWRIRDPAQFFRSFPQGIPQAEGRIARVVKADVRAVVGRHTFGEVLTSAREEVMREIAAEAQETLGSEGVAIVDVRINRTEMPPGTRKNVYARMRAERERLARKYRAEGEAEGRRIRAGADREARVIVAEARRDAEVLRGQGDAEATAIYAAAYQKDPDFYAFVRSLEAYRKTLGSETTLVLTPGSGFFRVLRDPAAGARAPGRAGP